MTKTVTISARDAEACVNILRGAMTYGPNVEKLWRRIQEAIKAADEPSGDEAIIALADATERARGTRNIDPCLMELWDAVIKRRAQRRGESR